MRRRGRLLHDHSPGPSVSRLTEERCVHRWTPTKAPSKPVVSAALRVVQLQGAGDGTRTHDVQLGEATGLRRQASLYHGTRLQGVQTTLLLSGRSDLKNGIGGPSVDPASAPAFIRWRAKRGAVRSKIHRSIIFCAPRSAGVSAPGRARSPLSILRTSSGVSLTLTASRYSSTQTLAQIGPHLTPGIRARRHERAPFRCAP